MKRSKLKNIISKSQTIILSAQSGTKLEFKSELDWSPESWFSKRVRKPDGTLYNKQEAKILASHVPEYHNIEQTSKANGTWLKMPDGSTWEGDPRSWVMMQSKAFKKNYSSKPWYTGQAEWPTTFDYPNDNRKAIETNKMTRAPYYNGQMWFSDDKTYGDAFAYLYKSSGIGYRKNDPREQNIWGHNFLAAIPKKGIYRSLASPKKGTSDNWEQMPYFLKDNHIYRLPNSQMYIKGKVNYRKDRKKVLTDNVVNWSKNLGDQGIFLHKVSDGRGIKIKSPEIMRKVNNRQSVKKEDFNYTFPILEEFISQPGFTNRIKFIEGNTGDFDINNPYKYANVFKKINLNQV